MLLKKEPAYRKAEKEDFPLIREFIRRNYKDRWEFEEAHTETPDQTFVLYLYDFQRQYYRGNLPRSGSWSAYNRQRIQGPFCSGFSSEKRLSFPAPETYQRRPQESGTFQQTSGYEKTIDHFQRKLRFPKYPLSLCEQRLSQKRNRYRAS